MMRTCLRIYKIIQKCEKKKAIGATPLEKYEEPGRDYQTFIATTVRLFLIEIYKRDL